MVKNLHANAGDIRDVDSIPGSGRFPGEGNGYPLLESLRGEFHRWKSLAGYSPFGCNELDTIERLTFSLLFFCLP